MRGGGLLALALVVAACGDDKYGTYFEVRADDSAMQFDRLDFAFGVGAYVGGGLRIPAVPLAPDDPSPVAAPPTAGLLFHRATASADTQTFAAPKSAFSYYVPSTEESRRLGYVLVRAYLGDDPTPVGFAESLYFQLPTDEVAIYDMPLRAYDAQTLRTWGDGGEECIRRDRDASAGEDAIVVSPDDDSDCDMFPDDAGDCDPLVFCDPSHMRGCASSLQCITRDVTGGACRLSSQTCDNMDSSAATCANSGAGGVCLPAINCMCDPTLPPQEFLECSFASDASHPGADLDVPGPRASFICTPSSVTFKIKDPETNQITPCISPAVMAIAYPSETEPVQQFDFVPTTAADGVSCTITIIPKTVGSDFFPAIPHLLVAVSDPQGNRIGFVVGLSASGRLGCSTDHVQTNNTPVGSCEEP